MERTVPSTESEEIDLYQRTYYSLLRSTAEVKIRTLEEAHAGMNSLLHPAARQQESDMSAFIYSLLRLPDCMPQAKLVVLGQSLRVFDRAGFEQVNTWQEVRASARRRRCFFDGEHTLACFIASRSDIDDVIPLLTAYQVEWNKLHERLHRLPNQISLSALASDESRHGYLAKLLEISSEDLDRLTAIWDTSFNYNLQRIAATPCDFSVRLLSGSLNEYRRARNEWWDNIEEAAPELSERPVYFISSNTHSLINVLTGFALHHQERLLHFLGQSSNLALLKEWTTIQTGEEPASQENFLYYILKKYQQTPDGFDLVNAQLEDEQALGIQRVLGHQRTFDVQAQIIDLGRLKPARIDPRLGQAKTLAGWMPRSDAFILNIDYPLGLAAYDILSEIAARVGSVLGVYVMGKAATLNARAGDVMISNVVHDEHSQNTYLFQNCFSAADISPDLIYGTVLDNQKAMTVQGTFLQNTNFMDVFYREGYTDIEMEAGPYLSAIYEMYRPKRHPINEIVNLYGLPFDIGFLHYASDTPLSKGKNLGAGSLSYYGMDSTYAVTLAVARRIFQQEQQRVQNQRKPRG